MQEGRIKLFFGLGGNFLSAAPDTEVTADGLRQCRLTAHVSIKLNRSHLVTGAEALILPCLGRTERDTQAGGEQFVTVEDTMGVVHASRGSLPPASAELLSEPMIVARLAKATLAAPSVDWMGLASDYDRIRDHISRVIPGFEDFNQRVRQPGGFYLPNGPRQGEFTTPDAKAHFTVHPIPLHNLRDNELLMMTLRSHDQFNTTIYGLDDRYRGIYNGRRVIFMNRDDIRRLGFADKQSVDIVGEFGGRRRVASQFTVVGYDLPPRCCATYFPEANVLVPAASVADGSNQPASKSVVVTLRAAE